MNALRYPALWLAVAIVLLVGQTLVLFALDPSAVKALSIVVAVFLALLLLRGSRLAWAALLIGAAGHLVSSAISTESYWALAVGGIAVICLLAPSSVRLVWIQRPRRPAGRLRQAFERFYGRLNTSAYGMLVRVAGWENGELDTDATQTQRSYRLLIWRLGVSCVLLLVLVGTSESWIEDSEQANSVLTVIADVIWVCYALVQIAFIAVVLLAMYRHFFASHLPSESLRSKPK